MTPACHARRPTLADRNARWRNPMATEEHKPRSRRALLAAAAGAAGALAANAAMPLAAAAADPNDVVKGVDNPTTATTTISNSAEGSTAFAARSLGTLPAFGAVGS